MEEGENKKQKKWRTEMREGKIDVKGEIKRKHLKTEIKRWRNKERN